MSDPLGGDVLGAGGMGGDVVGGGMRAPDQIAGLDTWCAAWAFPGSKPDADPVAVWPDLSGNGHNLVQGTPANQPIYKINILNGRPVVRFDGLNDILSGAITPTATRTIFLVAKKRSVPATTQMTLFATGAFEEVFALSTFSGNQWARYATQANASIAIPNTYAASWLILAFRCASLSALTFFVDGGDQGTIDPSDAYSTYANIYLGENAGLIRPGDIDVAELAVFKSGLADPDLVALFAYFDAMYNIY